MAGMPRHFLIVLIAGLSATAFPVAAACCPFCTQQGQTLTDDVAQASMVLYGTFQNAKLTPGSDTGEGTTELVIEAVIKKHEVLNDRKKVRTVGEQQVIELERYVPADRDKKYKFVVFCDVFKGRIDPYRGVAVRADGDAAKYLQGALELKDKDVPTKLRFFFHYLDNPDVEISNDAFKEFANADYKDLRPIYKDLPADKVAKWLQDPKTPGFRYGLYASMLGHCGKDEHAAVLRAMLEDPDKRATSGIDGILAGYAMLKPGEGWKYLCGILKDPSREFTVRYAALRSVRFFWDLRPDLLTRKELVEGLDPLLDQSDIADLVIEDFRKWAMWDRADRILALAAQKSHDIPIIRRAILRYALSCPKPQASAYVKAVREQNPQLVRDAEELLKLETTGPTAGTPPASN